MDVLLQSVQSQLSALYDPHTSAHARQDAEKYLTAAAPECYKYATLALQQQAVLADPRLLWYLVSTLEKHLERNYWSLEAQEKIRLQQEIDAVLEHCVSLESPVSAKVYSLHSTLLCWRASEEDPAATEALIATASSNSTDQNTPHKLSKCIVIVEDLSAIILGGDGSTQGCLPAHCIQKLRSLYQSHLYGRFCNLSVTALTASKNDSTNGRKTCILSLKLLCRTISTAIKTLPDDVTSAALLSHVLPLLLTPDDDLRQAAQEVVHAITAMPMLPGDCSDVQHALLQLLAQHVPNTAASELSPLGFAQLAHNAICATSLDPFSYTPSAEAALQGLLRVSSEQACSVTNAATQLCLLEPWVLWLTRLSEVEDAVFDSRDPDAQLQIWHRKCEVYKQPLLQLVQALLPSLTLGQGHEHAAAVKVGSLDRSQESGGPLEEALATLASEGPQSMAVLEGYSCDSDDDGDARTCKAESPELEAWESSEMGIYSSSIDSFISQAVSLLGADVASQVWQMTLTALQQCHSAFISSDSQQLRIAILDVHVLCRLASRCACKLTGSTQPGLGYLESLISWVDAFTSVVRSRNHPLGWLVIAGAAVMQCVSSLTTGWLSERVLSTPPESVADLPVALHAVLQTSVSQLCLAYELFNHLMTPDPMAFLACSAAHSLLALTHVAVNPRAKLDVKVLQGLRMSVAAQQLNELCVRLALLPQRPFHLPMQMLQEVWTSFSDVQVIWLTHSGQRTDAEWAECCTKLRAACTPVLQAWDSLHTVFTRTPIESWKDWPASKLGSLCEFAGTLCSSVVMCPRPARRCLYSGFLEPLLEQAVPMLRAVLQHSTSDHWISKCAQESVLMLCSLSLRVVQSVLSDVPVAMISALIDANLSNPVAAGNDATAANKQVAQLVHCIVDDSAPHVAALLPGAVRFILTCAESSLAQASSSPPHAQLSCQALTTLMHAMSYRYQVLVKADSAASHSLPVLAVRHLVSLLDIAADTTLPSVQATVLLELLEEFFSMQKQTGLYRHEDLPIFRPRLQDALLKMLISTMWKALQEPLMDLLWGIGNTDWVNFVGEYLPAFCQRCGSLVAGRTQHLLLPFSDPHSSLNDFSHFSTCVKGFVNDVRFFTRLQSASV